MKRILCLILVFVMLFSLCACSSAAKTEETEEAAAKEDLSLLDAKTLYERALEKTANLSYTSYETTLLFDGVGKEIISRRVREGYDGFSYERRGEESLVITDGAVFVRSETGNFTASVTTRTAEEYLAEYWYPVTSLDAATLSDFSKDGLKVSYALADEKVIALYALAATDTLFVPESVTGEAQIGEDGIIEKETLTVLGKGADGEKKTLRLESVLTERGGELKISRPSGLFAKVGDIRVPHLLNAGIHALENCESLRATMLNSLALRGEKSASLDRVVTYYQTAPATFYLSTETLTKGVGEANLRTFAQRLQKDGKSTENEYDLGTATLLSEKEEDSEEDVLASLLSAYRLDLTYLENLVLTEDAEQVSVSFSVSEEGAKLLLESAKDSLSFEGEASLSEFTLNEGVFTISKKTGLLTVFSTILESESFSCRFSMTLEASENETLPQLQTPTAGDVYEDEEHDH